ncbi:MAG: TIGR03435 family protein [Janthinobacterium lividum]
MSPRRNVLCFTLVALISLSSLAAQNLTSTPTYDVSSVKPHDPDDRSMSWRSDEDGFRAVNVDLRSVISNAWDLRSDQVTGEPSWADDLHWDVTGKSTELRPDQLRSLKPEQRAQMMQQLLAERFHIRAHLEIRTGPIFTLAPAKGGLKLNPIAMTPEERATGKVAGTRLSVRGGQATVMEAKKVPLSLLVKNLAGNLHRTVIDKTGLPALLH